MPNGYILGEEGSGALIGADLRRTRSHQECRRPSGVLAGSFNRLGLQGRDRTMILVYNLDNVSSLYRRYAGAAGSAYVVAGWDSRS